MNPRRHSIAKLAAARYAADKNETGWAIDHSTGHPILTHNRCSVIQDEEAELIWSLLRFVGIVHDVPIAPKPMRHAGEECEQ
jgi:hypothetical protein